MDVSNIDLTYILDGSGWSSLYLTVDNTQHYFGPTHIFNNPLEELLTGITSFIKGADESSFDWFDEPGKFKWILIRDLEQQHLISVTLSSFSDCETSSNLIDKIEFKCQLNEFANCLYFQVLKLDKLLTNKGFAEFRNADFPRHAFKEFKNAMEKSYS